MHVGAVSPEERYWGRDTVDGVYRIQPTVQHVLLFRIIIRFDSIRLVVRALRMDQDFFRIMHDDVDCPLSHLLVFVVDGSFVCRRA